MRIILIFLALSLICMIFPNILIVPECYNSIQSAVIASADGDTVLVQPGIYYENINLLGRNIKLVSNYWFTQDSTFISNTIIDGNQNGSVVTFNHREDSLCIFCGFTVKNGSGYAYIHENFIEGGGIYILKNSNPVLTDLVIRDNTSGWGGGIRVHNSDPVLRNLNIYSNQSVYNGGGAYISYSNSFLENIYVHHNSSYQGAGLAITDSSPEIVDVLIESNNAIYTCGGVYLVNWNLICHTEFSGLTVQNNTAYKNAGLVIGGGTIKLTDSIIRNNCAEESGGGICIISQYMGTLDHILITGNSAPEGAALVIENFAEISNCTISDNMGDTAIHIQQPINFRIINSIISNPNSNAIYLEHADSRLYMVHSCLDGGFSAISGEGEVFMETGNIFADPCFSASQIDDYSLNSISPCIDSGIANYLWYDQTAFEYSEEFWGNAPDMGCYEYQVNSTGFDHIQKMLEINCYPNPFNPQTTINYKIERSSQVIVAIYNSKGQQVTILQNQYKYPGSYSLTWNANENPSGIYMIHIHTDYNTLAKKVVLLK